MKTTQSSSLYDPQSGSELMTSEQAAAHLGYHYASLRRLVSEGALKPYKNVGKTLLFLKTDILRFQTNHAWAASKAGLEKQPAMAEPPPCKLQATVEVSRPDKVFDGVWRKDPDFTWAKLPLLKADINEAYGDVDFRVKVKSPDGGSWQIRYFPESPLERVVKKVAGKFKRK